MLPCLTAAQINFFFYQHGIKSVLTTTIMVMPGRRLATKEYDEGVTSSKNVGSFGVDVDYCYQGDDDNRISNVSQ